MYKLCVITNSSFYGVKQNGAVCSMSSMILTWQTAAWSVAIHLVCCSEYERHYRQDKSDSSSAIKLSNCQIVKLSNCLLNMPTMPLLRTSSTQQSYSSISVIDTVVSNDTAVFVNIPPGEPTAWTGSAN